VRIRGLQHVLFEGPAAIADWARSRGHELAVTPLFRGEPPPAPDAFDALVLLGGPMSVNDEAEHAWLRPEKDLVRRAAREGRIVFGVCLGAQLVASALGQRVYPAAEKEIGWWPVRRVSKEGVGALLPEAFTPFHWHGETFDLPPDAVRLAETEAVPNQAFQLGDRVAGLQFHLEATPESVRALVENAEHEIEGGRFQQPAAEIRDAGDRCAAVRPILFALLDELFAGFGATTRRRG